jgi:hypothetical protein
VVRLGNPALIDAVCNEVLAGDATAWDDIAGQVHFGQSAGDSETRLSVFNSDSRPFCEQLHGNVYTRS